MYKFPFVVCSGKNYMSLIDVRQNLLSRFIETGMTNMQNSDVFFFYKRPYGYSLYFSQDRDKNNSIECKLYELQLKRDFHERLGRYGMLPSSELNDKFEKQEHAKLKYQTEMIVNKKTKNIIPSESFTYKKSNETFKILNNLTKYFRVKLDEE